MGYWSFCSVCVTSRAASTADVESLAPLAWLSIFRNARTTHAPLIGQVVQAVFALQGFPSLVFDFKPPVFADVAEVRRYGRHAPPSPGNLDHDLRGTPDNGGFDALADGVGSLVRARSAKFGLGPILDDAVTWIEKAVAPCDEDAVERGVMRRVGAVRMPLD